MIYEARRIFSDRMNSDERKAFESVLVKTINRKAVIFTSFNSKDNLLRMLKAAKVKEYVVQSLSFYQKTIGLLDISLSNTILRLITQINHALTEPNDY
jgi:hypothetical protein